MKTLSLKPFPLLFALLCLSLNTRAQDVSPADSTGLPGDHFSLQGAIELFKKAGSPEEFEKLLNQEDNGVNNLDLNLDGQVDYIRVIDNMEGDVHAIVLQVPVNDAEAQDIAVIAIEKTGAEEAILQIVGDPDVYGSEIIAEPFQDETQKKGKGGPHAHLRPLRIVVNVWGWPCVGFIYRPGYRVYVSPWRWALYPNWWRPWRPVSWRAHYVRVRPYHTRCHVVTTHRVVRAHNVYKPRRTSSTVVRTRTTTTVKVQGRNGNVQTAQRTTTQTKAQGRNGNVTRQKTTTTRTGPRGNSVTRQKSTTTRGRKRGG